MKKAINIVILPPDDVIDSVIAIDRRSNDDSDIVLNKENRLPHISLLMGVMDESNLAIMEAIEELTGNTDAFGMTIDRYEESKMGNGLLCTAPSQDLSDLHKSLLTKIDPLLTHDSIQQNFADSSVDQAYVEYVNAFPEKQNTENFNPHITTRPQKEPIPELPITFIADTIAVFQLGQRCTCVHEIVRFTLSHTLL